MGRRARYPGLRELYSGALGRFLENPNLRPEMLASAELGATWRWSGGVAQLRFPQAGTGAPQTLRLRVDGRARPDDVRFSVLLGEREVASVPLSRSDQVYEVPLPATPAGAGSRPLRRASTYAPKPAAQTCATANRT